MAATFDRKGLEILFHKPETDGAFTGPALGYLRALGRSRPVLLLSFAPKSAGTFFRQAAIDVVGGALFRVTHAQGGRDGTPYLPTFLACYLDPESAPIVAHIHMQALPANRNFIDAFGLKPVIMIRSVPDMLASYWDMLDADPVARADGLNCQIPGNFVGKGREAKADFMIDVLAPWYASYFATWKDFVDAAPETVCVLRYPAFRADPAASVHRALLHAGFAATREKCDEAVAKIWDRRGDYRFNKGFRGRGPAYFSAEQLTRPTRLLSHYPQLEPWNDVLIGPAAEEKIRLAS